ncbi:DNA-directed DNA polymerase gamma mip1 [Dinochytrium kinnereticum]|nr:DNA-directed DNA polymerase gamma mip1 [Dinochytrium kinnereticum]
MKLNADGLTNLEQPLIKVPLEQFKRAFKTSQRHFEKELTLVNSAAEALLEKDADSTSAEDAIKSLDGMVNRLHSLKRKLKDSKSDEAAIVQRSRSRLEHLNELGGMQLYESPGYERWSKTRLNRILVDYMLRQGFFQSADYLTNTSGIESKLEFNLRLQEYIEFVRERKLKDAITYLRKWLTPFNDIYMKEIQLASALLAFNVQTECDRYKMLFDVERWNQLIEQFRADNFALNCLTRQPLLRTSLQAGLTALKTPMCYDASNRNLNCPVCSADLFGAIADKLPNAHHLNSCLVCKISGGIMNEDNSPMVLPNGNVYGAKSLEDMARKAGGVVNSMPQSDKRQDLDRIGLFSEASYISAKEPFTDKRNEGFLANRAKGKQFLTTPPKKGHNTRDAFFDKDFIRLFENEPYTDLVVLRRRYRLQQKEKNISTVPFKPSSVPPKPSGSGSLFGTIEQQWPLPKKDLVLRSAPAEEKGESKPNFLTKPPKKGTGYGYPNVTIGKPYEYVSDPYDRYLEITRKDRLESKKKMIGERAFISSSAKLDFFNSFAGLIGEKKSAAPSLSRQRNQNALPPFKPSSCCGYTINKYPAFELPSGASESAKVAEKIPRKLEPIFRPSGISKSYPIRSIVEATCPIAPPVWLQELITLNISRCFREFRHWVVFSPSVQNEGEAFLTILKISKALLDKFKLSGKLEPDSDPIEFPLPSLASGEGGGLGRHFEVLGVEHSMEYRRLAGEFASKRLPKVPKKWEMKVGWTRYDEDGPVSVEYPDADALVFDVETIVPEHPMAVMAVAASADKWYSWVSPRLLRKTGRATSRQASKTRDQLSLDYLIPLGPSTKERIVVGHAVSYDRARVLEEYRFESNKCGWIDTMSLHTAIAGLSSQQRPAWKKKKKETMDALENAERENDGTVDIPDEVIDGMKAWMTTSSLPSLKYLANFYLNYNMSKSERDVFVKGSTEEVLADFQNLMSYCAKDVWITHGIFCKTLPAFLMKCPHPVSFAGMIEMGKMFLTTTDGWSEFVRNAEDKFQSNAKAIEEELLKVASEALATENWEEDPWLRNLDWEYPSARAKVLVDKPQWYRDLWDSKEKRVKLSLSKRVVPYLLKLEWKGYPLFHTSECGWTFCVPSKEASNLSETPIPPSKLPETVCKERKYYRIPHRDGDYNVGNPLSRPFIKALEDGVLTSSNPRAKEILLLSSECSYWLSARNRILRQLVVDTSPLNSAYRGDANKSLHVIIPQVVSMGTVTRRAIENTWLTASNAKKNRIGSELKALVEAPPGYSIVGADVDSEELWICSLIGDAQFRIHGGTPLGFMTLQGNKKNRTDLHSVTGDIVGITRDAAKVFNYSRLYGAGIKHTTDLLAKNNPGIPREELRKRANKLFLETKGTRCFTGGGRRNSKAGYWSGGTESYLFNELERIAQSSVPVTPVLGCEIPESLLPENVEKDFLTTRVNWIVQSSGVDYLHLLLVGMNYLMRRMKIRGRFMISIHDEVRFLVHNDDAILAAFALNISNLWTRAMFASELGIDDLPQNVAFFSAVDIDHVLRKEVDMDCVTPSNPSAIPKGVSVTIQEILVKLDEEKKNLKAIYGDELPSIVATRSLFESIEQDTPKPEPEVNIEWLQTQMMSMPAAKNSQSLRVML